MSIPSENVSSKVALVTGGARRIGAAIVRALHAAGMRIVLHYHQSGDEARALGDELDAVRAGSVHLLHADLRDATAVNEMVESTTNAFSRLDVLVNNASCFYSTPLGTIDETGWHELVEVNLKAPLFLAQSARASLEETRGCIVNIADIYASMPLGGYATYCVTKAGLVMLTRALAVELAPHIRVNAVAPGAILWPAEGANEDKRAAMLANIPLRHLGDPADIGQAVLFLVRDAHYMTGQTIKVDGGRAIGWR